ncbi:MAG: hypothetical protein NC133_00115 [Prevotella sp.]|nr:hypothetical protein [Prevotella sp.]
MTDNQSNNHNKDTKRSKLTFETVDLSLFLGSEDTAKTNRFHNIIAKIADNNQEVTAGLEALFHETVSLPSFERAITLLITAKNERQLQAVEAALQVTINVIKKYHAQRSPYMTTKKTALYLYTLQYLITHLGNWKFQNKELNNFKPALVQKLQDVKQKSNYLGINDAVVHNECFTTIYQQPNHPILSNFEFLDEQRLDAFANRLSQIELRQNTRNYSSNLTDETMTKRQKAFVDQIINYLECILGVPKLNSAMVIKNQERIQQAIGGYIRNNDSREIDKIMRNIMFILQKTEMQSSLNNGLTL